MGVAMGFPVSKRFCFVAVFDRPMAGVVAVHRVVDTTTWIVNVSIKDAAGIPAREDVMVTAAIAHICGRVHAIDGWRFVSAVRVSELLGRDDSHMRGEVDMAKVNI
jgi:hypothetical protein